MRGVLLVGHGSLRPGAGAAMIRLAARVREAGIAPIVGAGFLNYSRPRFADALARLAAHGAREIVVQPYFLAPGKFVRVDLPRAVRAAQEAHPALTLRLAEPFGDHEALAALALKRAAEACDRAPGPMRGHGRDSGLLLMAHGSPDASANRPIAAVAERIRAVGRYEHVVVCYLDLNTPSIPTAIDELAARGVRRMVATPYFLQLGGHVAEDLPAIIAAARLRHPTAAIALAEHLGYDPLLVRVIADRAASAAGEPIAPRETLDLGLPSYGARRTLEYSLNTRPRWQADSVLTP
jgi:sirohydrochlorin cobaltochelatase